jgi:hypothetical protein
MAILTTVALGAKSRSYRVFNGRWDDSGLVTVRV